MLKLKQKIIARIACFFAITFVGSMVLNTAAYADGNKVWKWVKTGPYTWYYVEVDASEAMDKGWVLDHSDLLWRYYNDDGSYKTGWFYDKGNWYYFYPDGIMAYNTKVDGYYLNADGAWTNEILPSVYTSYEVMQGMTKLGFASESSIRAYNLYANNNERNLDRQNHSFDHMIMNFNICQLEPGRNQTKGDDFILTIMKNDDDTKGRVKSALKVLLPSQWETLYNSIDFSNNQDKTLNLEGRTINVKSNKCIMITFGPIVS